MGDMVITRWSRIRARPTLSDLTSESYAMGNLDLDGTAYRSFYLKSPFCLLKRIAPRSHRSKLLAEFNSGRVPQNEGFNPIQTQSMFGSWTSRLGSMKRCLLIFVSPASITNAVNMKGTETNSQRIEATVTPPACSWSVDSSWQ